MSWSCSQWTHGSTDISLACMTSTRLVGHDALQCWQFLVLESAFSWSQFGWFLLVTDKKHTRRVRYNVRPWRSKVGFGTTCECSGQRVWPFIATCRRQAAWMACLWVVKAFSSMRCLVLSLLTFLRIVTTVANSAGSSWRPEKVCAGRKD